MSPAGAGPHIGLSIVVSATSGAATGAGAAFTMARQRVSVPDARHNGDGPAPMVSVPPFQVATPAAPPDRFTGPTKTATAVNIAKGSLDRIGQMGKATAALGAASLTGPAIAAALPDTPGDVAHRIIQAGVLGAGVAAAVEPWFKAQPEIAGRDAARRAPPPADIEMTAPGAAR